MVGWSHGLMNVPTEVPLHLVTLSSDGIHVEEPPRMSSAESRNSCIYVAMASAISQKATGTV